MLKQLLPGLKRNAEKGSSAEVQAGRALLRGFCRICGDNLTQTTKSKLMKGICNVCHGRLLDGETALTAADGRYAFVKSDGSEEAKALEGRIVPIESKSLDELAASQGIEIKENPNFESN